MPRVILKKRSETTKQVKFSNPGDDFQDNMNDFLDDPDYDPNKDPWAVNNINEDGNFDENFQNEQLLAYEAQQNEAGNLVAQESEDDGKVWSLDTEFDANGNRIEGTGTRVTQEEYEKQLQAAMNEAEEDNNDGLVWSLSTQFDEEGNVIEGTGTKVTQKEYEQQLADYENAQTYDDEPDMSNVGPDIGDIEAGKIDDVDNIAGIGSDAIAEEEKREETFGQTDEGFGGTENISQVDAGSFNPDVESNPSHVINENFWTAIEGDPATQSEVNKNLDGDTGGAIDPEKLAQNMNNGDSKITDLKCKAIQALKTGFFSTLNPSEVEKMSSKQVECITAEQAKELSSDSIQALEDAGTYGSLTRDARAAIERKEDQDTNKDTNEKVDKQNKEKKEEARKKADQNTDNKPRLYVNNPTVSEGSALDFQLTLSKPLEREANIKAEILGTGSAVLGTHYDQVNSGSTYSNANEKFTVKENDKKITLTPLQHINRGDDLNISISGEQEDDILLSIRTVYLDDIKKNGVTIKIKFTCVDEENNDSLIYEKEKGDGVIATGIITDLKKKEEETEKKIENGEWKVEIKGSVGDKSYRVTSANKLMTNDEIVKFIQNNAKLNDENKTNLSDYTHEDINNSITSIEFKDYTEIPNKLLENCINLTTITIPNTVTSIGKYAFSNTGITSYKVNSHVKKLGTHVFYNCQKLTSIHFDTPKLDSLNTNSNFHYQLPSNICSSCTKLTSVTLNKDIKSFSGNMFNGCRNLKISGLDLSNIQRLFSSSLNNCGQNILDDTFTIPQNIKYLSHDILSGTNVTTIDATNITNFNNIFHTNGKTFNGLTGTGITVKLSSDTTIPTDNDNFSVQNKKFYGATNVVFKQNSKVVQTKTNNDYDVRIIGTVNGTEYEIDLESSDIAYTSKRNTKLREKMNDNTISNDDLNKSITGVDIKKYSNETLPSYAFENCTNLTNVTLAEGVTKINKGAFYNCSSLGATGFNIPNGVTTIDQKVFEGCSSITSINIPITVTTFNTKRAFYSCTSLTSITIPSIVTIIDNDAFYECRGLTSVTIPNSVTSIGDRAFDGCSSLTSVTISTNVTKIGESAFSGCSSLTGITIPSKVNTINDRAFSKCTGLKDITIPSTVTNFGSGVYYRCTGLTNVNYQTTTTIPTYMFSMCSKLETVTFPEKNTITTLNDSTFNKCENLTTLNNLTNITTINSSALSGCRKLDIDDLIKNVKTIGDNAFFNTYISSIKLPQGITNLSSKALHRIVKNDNLTVNVPNTDFFDDYNGKELNNDDLLKEFYGELPGLNYVIKKYNVTKSISSSGSGEHHDTTVQKSLRKRRIIIR